MRLSFADKISWAKKAASLDVDTEKGQEEFYRLAKESGLSQVWLTYYANAYEAAGESGLKTLAYRKKMPAEIRKQAMKKINEFLAKGIPPHLRKEIGYLMKAKDNRIIVFEKRPLFSDPLRTSCIEIFQVRYTDYDNRWHLYWMRKFGKWWPYVPKKPVYTIEDCIREVENDAWGCFWG